MKSRTNPVFMWLSNVLCDCIEYVRPFESDAKQHYFLLLALQLCHTLCFIIIGSRHTI